VLDRVDRQTTGTPPIRCTSATPVTALLRVTRTGGVGVSVSRYTRAAAVGSTARASAAVCGAPSRTRVLAVRVPSNSVSRPVSRWRTQTVCRAVSTATDPGSLPADTVRMRCSLRSSTAVSAPA